MYALRYSISLSLVVLINGLLMSQDFKLLHYTETSGWDHNTRTVSLEMFNELAEEHNFQVDNDDTGDAFNTLENLEEYAVVVFSNTSGDGILNSDQRANFEMYMENGGAFVGIHAASDTYRHSLANGPNTGTWDWYAEMLGGSVQTSPNHTNANYAGTMHHVGSHPTINNLPDPWEKVEEYYYWENGFFDLENNAVLEVESTGNESYDAERPMSWYRTLEGGGKSFYTALGHAGSNFTSDTLFRNHIRDAVLWAVSDVVTGLVPKKASLGVFPNPARDFITVQIERGQGTMPVRVFDVNGKTMLEAQLNFNDGQSRLNVASLAPGSYFISVLNDSDRKPVIASFVVQ